MLNLTREHFELALLLQSIFMIIAQVGNIVSGLESSDFVSLTQLALLYICILYRPSSSLENRFGSSRLFSFWQWRGYPQYLEFLAGLM